MNSVLSETWRYTISDDSWAQLGNLEQARSKHSGCYLGTHAYVYGGLDAQNNALGTIERMDQSGSWTAIIIDEEEFVPRYHALFAPLNSTELVIMGGMALSEEDDDFQSLGDVWIFKTSDSSVSRQCRNFKGLA